VPLSARASTGSGTVERFFDPVHEQLQARSGTGLARTLREMVIGLLMLTTLAAVALRAPVRPELIQLQGRHP
jgi:hypothetical protein